jgi:hypothetical protein
MGNTTDNPGAQGFASTSVTRHLARGAVGFGAITSTSPIVASPPTCQGPEGAEKSRTAPPPSKDHVATW